MPIGWRKVRRLVEDALALAAPSPSGHELIVRHGCDNVSRTASVSSRGTSRGTNPPRLGL